MRKVKESCPDFGDLIAYNDLCGRQIVLRGDNDLRTAIHETKGKLKIYTTVADLPDSKM
uniref:KHA domain-containing protein n=1 Tax=Steinernema glaseri TaxID=37863 RepID=A0A1I8AGU8_9BILA